MSWPESSEVLAASSNILVVWSFLFSPTESKLEIHDMKPVERQRRGLTVPEAGSEAPQPGVHSGNVVTMGDPLQPLSPQDGLTLQDGTC